MRHTQGCPDAGEVWTQVINLPSEAIRDVAAPWRAGCESGTMCGLLYLVAVKNFMTHLTTVHTDLLPEGG